MWVSRIFFRELAQTAVNPKISLIKPGLGKRPWTFQGSSTQGLVPLKVPFFYQWILPDSGPEVLAPGIRHSQKSLQCSWLEPYSAIFKLWGEPLLDFTTEWVLQIFGTTLFRLRYGQLCAFNITPLREPKGWAYGADFRLFGEFVPGTDSWISLSLIAHPQRDI